VEARNSRGSESDYFCSPRNLCDFELFFGLRIRRSHLFDISNQLSALPNDTSPALHSSSNRKSERKMAEVCKEKKKNTITGKGTSK